MEEVEVDERESVNAVHCEATQGLSARVRIINQVVAGPPFLPPIWALSPPFFPPSLIRDQEGYSSIVLEATN